MIPPQENSLQLKQKFRQLKATWARDQTKTATCSCVVYPFCVLDVLVQVDLVHLVGVGAGVFEVVLGDEGLEGVADDQDHFVCLRGPTGLSEK